MKNSRLFIIVACFVIAVLLTLGFINDCNFSTKAELLSQKLDSVADRQSEIAKPIDISVRQEDTLNAIDKLQQEMYAQFHQIRLLLESFRRIE